MIVNWGLVDISSSMTLETVAGIAAIGMGLCASAGGVLMYLNPDGIEKGSDPAPGYMFIIAGIGTVAFVITTVLSIAIETDVW